MRISDWSSDVCSSDLETEFIGNAFAAAAETPAPDGVLWHVGKNDRTLGTRGAFIEIAAREPLHDRIMLLHRHLLDVNQRDAGDDRRTVQRRMIFDGNILAAGIISLLRHARESGKRMGKACAASFMDQGPIGNEAEARRGGRFGGSGRRLGGAAYRKHK